MNWAIETLMIEWHRLVDDMRTIDKNGGEAGIEAVLVAHERLTMWRIEQIEDAVKSLEDQGDSHGHD